jgi:hypothetical protein
MDKAYFYDNGTPFQDIEKVNNNIDKLIIRKNEKKPCLIIIDGISSSGKTTKAVELVDIINKKHGLSEVDLSPKGLQIGTGASDFLSKLRPCAEAGLPAIIFDEAGEYNKRGWNSKLNKIMDSVIDTFRAYKIIIFFVLHDFTELPKHVWNAKIPTFLIHLKERKKGVGRTYWYELKSMYYIINNRTKEVFPEASYDKVYPNFRCEFKNLPPERATALDRLSTKAKKDKLEGSEIAIQGLLGYGDIAKLMLRSEAWVKKTIRTYHMKEERTFKKKKYYTQEILQKLNSKILR